MRLEPFKLKLINIRSRFCSIRSLSARSTSSFLNLNDIDTYVLSASKCLLSLVGWLIGFNVPPTDKLIWRRDLGL